LGENPSPLKSFPAFSSQLYLGLKTARKLSVRFRRKRKQRAKKETEAVLCGKGTKTEYFKWKRKRKRVSSFRWKENGKEIPEIQIWKLSGNISGLGPCKEALHLHDKTRPG
jgi:hypothetical protein